MRPLPRPSRWFCLLCLLCLLPLVSSVRAQEEPLRPGDRIDVTLQSGAIFEYAKVIEVTRDSIMVANPQGVREFAAKHLTPDLQARLPGATPPPAPPPTPKPAEPVPTSTPAPVASQPPPVDLDALAAALSAKLNANQPQPVAQPISELPAPAPAKNAPLDALVIGLLLVIPTLNVLATRSVILHTAGSAVPVWILAIWLLPLVGCLCAFSALGRNQTPPTTPAQKG
ncbi:MAG: hypothetical protein ABII82_00355 [Verrucomicrobiota bacterium]